jgi:sugar phosphate isomerase/epimerase
MKLGAISSTLRQLDFEENLRHFRDRGIEAVEIACAGFHEVSYGEPGKLIAEKLLGDKGELDRFLDLVGRYGLEISALAVHGEPLTPDKQRAEEYARQFRQACELAEALGVDRLTLLAGLPEGGPGDGTPNWITCPFPYSLMESYRWQWQERVIPYWQKQATIADAHGVRLCFEMHPGDVVFNPESLMKLREALGPVAGCNFDASHLFWQGIDPLEALRFLGDGVYHVHAKDLMVEVHNTRLNGFMDPKPFGQVKTRSWTFRTPGWGHDEHFWRSFVGTLRLIGYEDVISLEIEGDEFMEPLEGLDQAVSFLKPLMLELKPGVQWWHATYVPAGTGD